MMDLLNPSPHIAVDTPTTLRIPSEAHSGSVPPCQASVTAKAQSHSREEMFECSCTNNPMIILCARSCTGGDHSDVPTGSDPSPASLFLSTLPALDPRMQVGSPHRRALVHHVDTVNVTPRLPREVTPRPAPQTFYNKEKQSSQDARHAATVSRATARTTDTTER